MKSIEQKIKSDQKEMDKIYAGKNTLKTFFKSES